MTPRVVNHLAVCQGKSFRKRQYMTMQAFCLLVLALMGFSPRTALACGLVPEPPAALLSLMAGPYLITFSWLGFVLAVVIKCVAFAGFATTFPTGKAMVGMLRAHLSTFWVLSLALFGLIIGVFNMGFPLLWVLPLLIFYGLTMHPAKSLATTTSLQFVRRPHLLATWLSAMVVVMFVLFLVGAEAFHQQRPAWWMLKLAAIYVVLAIGMTLTTLWELRSLQDWTEKVARPMVSYAPVLQASLLTQLVFIGTAAMMVLRAPLISLPALGILLLVIVGLTVLFGWPRRLIQQARRNGQMHPPQGEAVA